jgi:hypothetical protein
MEQPRRRKDEKEDRTRNLLLITKFQKDKIEDLTRQLQSEL